MHFFTQTRFPKFWLLAQKSIGGTKDKQALALSRWHGERRILEIGCSVGNISDAFRNLPNIHFLGLDTDTVALGEARTRFAPLPHFEFTGMSMESLADTGRTFDYILFAAVLHHVDDDKAVSMLRASARLAAPHGRILIFEPDALRADDTIIFKLFYKLEQGLFLRRHEDLRSLVTQSGLAVLEDETVPIRPGLPLAPVVARFSVFLAAE